jgi:rhodanese-related sulfurtransferase
MTMDGKYAGDVSSPEAWRILEEDPNAALVDVRTDPEWSFIGLPDLSSLRKRVICISWQVFPDMHVNDTFVEEVARKGIAPDHTVLLLCRSGVRSRYAAVALTERGFQRCYNVSDGFEGPHDEERHRGTVAGWQFSQLPWRQG